MGGVENAATDLDPRQAGDQHVPPWPTRRFGQGEDRRQDRGRRMNPLVAVGGRLPGVVEVVGMHGGAVGEGREPRRQPQIGPEDG